MRRRLACGSLLALSLAAQAAPCPQPLRIGFNDTPFPPALLGRGAAFADPPGWVVVAVRDALQRLGCPARLLRLPGRRLTLALQRGDIEFALFYGATPERVAAFAFPLDATGQPDAAWAPMLGHLAFYGLAGSPALKAWDGTTLAPGVRVGVVGGSTQELLARERGWPVSVASAFDTSVLALKARRFDLLLASRESVLPSHLEGESALVELSPLVQRLPYYVPASAAAQARHGEFVTAFWREVCHASRRAMPEARGLDCGKKP